VGFPEIVKLPHGISVFCLEHRNRRIRTPRHSMRTIPLPCWRSRAWMKRKRILHPMEGRGFGGSDSETSQSGSRKTSQNCECRNSLSRSRWRQNQSATGRGFDAVEVRELISLGNHPRRRIGRIFIPIKLRSGTICLVISARNHGSGKNSTSVTS
jgi:hypothetical protein